MRMRKRRTSPSASGVVEAAALNQPTPVLRNPFSPTTADAPSCFGWFYSTDSTSLIAPLLENSILWEKILTLSGFCKRLFVALIFAILRAKANVVFPSEGE
jgi:hypothetical protein